MNSITIHNIRKYSLYYFSTICNVRRIIKSIPRPYLTTTISVADTISHEAVDENRSLNNHQVYSVENKFKEVSTMSEKDVTKELLSLMTNNNDKVTMQLINHCCDIRKFIHEDTLKRLFRNYSIQGKPDVVEVIQKYSGRVNPTWHKRNGEFYHYIAKAQCMKGNSDKGLSVLTNCYGKFENLRCFYRIIFRELIHDSVLNRSEASLVIFKKYILKFSAQWGDHYPLMCLWHICWSSSWFSDQMLANDLLESSKALQDIIKDKASAFSLSVLKDDFNEDAVMRLLQTLLKYDMMVEYAKTLQVLFNYKLRNRDIRGCSEIIRNCEVLGIKLPSNQQGRYIKMLIDGNELQKPQEKPPLTNFKLKF